MMILSCYASHRRIRSCTESAGMSIRADGVKPNPSKVEALDHLQPPTNKQNIISFLCMMQSNSDFIPNFSRRSSKLRELSKGNVEFKWTIDHETCFKDLIEVFRKDVLLRYFDLSKPIFIFTDTHITGLGAILARGESTSSAKPVALASCTTNPAETCFRCGSNGA